MNPDFLLPLGASACVCLAVFFFLKSSGRVMIRKGVTAFRKHTEENARSSLDALFTPVSSDRYFMLSVGSILIFSLLFAAVFKHISGILVGFPIGYLAPRLYLRKLLSQRKTVFHRQIPDILTLMVNSLRAGSNLAQGLQTVADDMEAPAGEEFRYVLQRHKMGDSLPDALTAFDQRMNDRDLSMCITATLVSLQTGCNLADMYERLAVTLRRREVLDNKIKALTSQGKMQGVIVGLLPVGLMLVINTLSPGTFNFFFHSLWGGILLTVGIILEILGIFFIRKIVTIDV